jgi:hypothetical protein
VVAATLLQVVIMAVRGRRSTCCCGSAWHRRGARRPDGWFHNETFIKWKPTVYYWLAAIAMLATQHVFHKNPLRALMGRSSSCPTRCGAA